MCVSEKDCHIDHDRISVKDIQKMVPSIRELETVCQKVKVMYQDELKKTTELEKEVKETKDSLTSSLTKINNACVLGSSINLASTEHDTTETMASLLEVVHQCSTTSLPSVRELSMERLKLEVGAAVTIGHTDEDVDMVKDKVKDREWQWSGKFCMPKEFVRPQSIAVDQSGDIAVTSAEKGVVLLSPTGQVKCYFTNCRKHIVDIAVTPDNRFIVPGDNKLLCYNDGQQVSTIDIADAWTQTLTVDRCGRIIAYTPDSYKYPWSIHDADGMKISSFKSTGNVPSRLDSTCACDIVFIQWYSQTKRCADVKLMNCNGGDVRILNPPPQVTEWYPRDVCCSKKQSEIFVSNWGTPTAVYKYTAQGTYVGCVTTDVGSPTGIALSTDEKELFVAEHRRQLVKWYRRI